MSLTIILRDLTANTVAALTIREKTNIARKKRGTGEKGKGKKR